jgi:glycosyltransferase involved in cell wall biosynthesis
MVLPPSVEKFSFIVSTKSLFGIAATVGGTVTEAARFSVVIPAHNEEILLSRGLRAIRSAEREVGRCVEIVVVANRCTDATAEIARNAGALVVENDARNISSVRNAGAAAASGTYLVTIDADSLMSSAALTEIQRLLESCLYVGGGSTFRAERASAGILATMSLVRLGTWMARVSGVMFWCRRSDFEAIGGFDEGLLLAEDVDFARRLRAHGRKTGRKFATLRGAPVVTSTRKFDQFGDWHMFAMAFQLKQIHAAFRGTDTTWVDRYFFEFNDRSRK